GEHGDRPVLDSLGDLRAPGSGYFEIEMNAARYKNKNVAVLGAGLSGSAAALLLRSQGANVTVLDTADEKNLLKSTINNLRAQGIRVICGPNADRDSSTYQLGVLSP